VEEKTLIELLSQLLRDLELTKFIVFVLTLIIFMTLPTFLTMIKERSINKKFKEMLDNINISLITHVKEIHQKYDEDRQNIMDFVEETFTKIDAISDKYNNTFNTDSVRNFIQPVYKNIALKIYKELDFALYHYKMDTQKREIELKLKRDISVLFTKAYNLLGKYKHTSGHKLSYFLKDTWEYDLHTSLIELIYKEKPENIRKTSWVFLENYLEEIIEEIQYKIQFENNKKP
jgi:hypothetical protein